jgi:hypothetical protein
MCGTDQEGIVSNGGVEEMVQSLRRIVITGTVATALVLVGALMLLALGVLFQVSRFAPFGGWGVLLVLAGAAVAAVVVWVQGPGAFGGMRTRRRVLATDVVLRAPPPVPTRPPRMTALPLQGAAGRLGAETAVNRLIAERRYDGALAQLDELEATDPEMASFCAVKRRAIARRRVRDR